jgi:hypothetical protein
VAGVHHQHRRLVIRDVGVDRSDEADVVGALADVREELADVHPDVPVFLERERRPHQRASLALGGDGAARQRLPVVLVEHRLRIEAVHLREAAVHEQKNDALGARGVIEPADLQAVRGVASAGGVQRIAQQAGKRHHAEAVAHAAQRFASRQRIAGLVPHRQLTNRNSFELRSTLR